MSQRFHDPTRPERLIHPLTRSYLKRVKVKGKWRWQAFTAQGKFADKGEKRFLTKYFFGRRFMYRVTIAQNWVVHGIPETSENYYASRLQIWSARKGYFTEERYKAWMEEVFKATEKEMEERYGYTYSRNELWFDDPHYSEPELVKFSAKLLAKRREGVIIEELWRKAEKDNDVNS